MHKLASDGERFGSGRPDCQYCHNCREFGAMIFMWHRRFVCEGTPPGAAVPQSLEERKLTLSIPCHSEGPVFGLEESRGCWSPVGSLTCHDGGGSSSPHPSARSCHFGFTDSIRAIFFLRAQPLISFSRRIAARTFVKTS